MPLVLALDQGTTSSRAIVFDESGEKLSQVQIPLPQIFPQPGWVEQDAADHVAATSSRSRAQAIARGRAHRGRHRRARHHQPARDRRRVGPRDRRAAPQRDRLAGPPHLRGVRRARRAQARTTWSRERPDCRSTRTSRRPRSPGSSTTSTGARARAERGRPRVRHRRHLVPVAAHRRSGARHRRHRTPRARCCSTSSDGAWDDGAAASCSACRMSLLPEVVRSSGVVGTTAPGVFERADPDRLDRAATSRPRSWATAASRRATRRRPSVPASSRSCTPAPSGSHSRRSP